MKRFLKENHGYMIVTGFIAMIMGSSLDDVPALYFSLLGGVLMVSALIGQNLDRKNK